MKNHRGLTAADVAEQSNQSALAQFLRRAVEQAEFGSVTLCENPNLPISDLNEAPAHGGNKGNDAHSHIIMNGEGIYNSSCNYDDFGVPTDNEVEMEEEIVSEGQSLNFSAASKDSMKVQGAKRSFDESEEIEHFHKRRCTGM